VVRDFPLTSNPSATLGKRGAGTSEKIRSNSR
jgi:hypothetical protein